MSKKSWFSDDRYDDEYKEIDVNRTRGVNGVMLPNDLSPKEYEAYVKARSGEVKTYNIKDKEEKKDVK